MTLGLDPGLRTGVKVVIVDGTGKLLTPPPFFPHAPRNQWEDPAILAKLCQTFQVELISIGNGTASRETDKLAAELIKRHPELNFKKLSFQKRGPRFIQHPHWRPRNFLIWMSPIGALFLLRGDCRTFWRSW